MTAGLNGNGAELVRVERTQVQRHQSTSLDFTDEDRQMIRDMYANGASEPEFRNLMMIAKVHNLNPIKREIFFVQRWDNEKKRMVWAAQVSIDGLRLKAERTGMYDGQDEPEFEHDKEGRPVLARVRVYRKDWSRPAVGVAYFGEYAATTKEGNLTKMWREKPHVMIAKCAEALAIRKGFPSETAGLYAKEEMGDEDDGDEQQRPPLRSPLRARQTQAVVAAEVVPPAAEEQTEEEQTADWCKRFSEAADANALQALRKEFKATPRASAVTMAVSKAYEERKRALGITTAKAATATPAKRIKIRDEHGNDITPAPEGDGEGGAT